jgi:hypothetical protein
VRRFIGDSDEHTLLYQNVTLIEPQITVVCDDTDNGWILFDPNPPEHKVVLAHVIHDWYVHCLVEC